MPRAMPKGGGNQSRTHPVDRARGQTALVSVTPATPGERCPGPVVVMVETQASGQSPAIPLQETPSDTPGLDATVILGIDKVRLHVSPFLLIYAGCWHCYGPGNSRIHSILRYNARGRHARWQLEQYNWHQEVLYVVRTRYDPEFVGHFCGDSGMGCRNNRHAGVHFHSSSSEVPLGTFPDVARSERERMKRYTPSELRFVSHVVMLTVTMDGVC